MCITEVKKRDGLIEIDYLDSKENPLSVDFWGFNEGSGTPCKNEKEVKKKVEELIKEHQEKYKIKIEDKRIKQRTL